MKYDLSICIPLGPAKAKKWLPWLNHQLLKVKEDLLEKGYSFEIIIGTEIPILECMRVLDDLLEIKFIQTSAKVGAKRNKMNKLARGTYIAQMDADDWFPKYRFSFQLEQLISKNQKITTVSKIPCFDVRTKEFLLNTGFSESCLMYHRKVAKSKFGSSVREGNNFCFGHNIYVIDDPILIIALTHGSNTVLRSGSLLETSLDIFDEFEKDFLFNKF